MKEIQEELQHAYDGTDIDMKIRNVRKTHIERRKTNLLNDVKIRKKFQEKVIELIDVGATNLRILKYVMRCVGSRREVKEINNNNNGGEIKM